MGDVCVETPADGVGKDVVGDGAGALPGAQAIINSRKLVTIIVVNDNLFIASSFGFLYERLIRFLYAVKKMFSLF